MQTRASPTDSQPELPDSQLPQAGPGKLHGLSLLQLVLSALATIVLWGGALVLFLAGVSGFFSPEPAAGSPVSPFLMAATAGVAGLLLVPSVVYALRRLSGRPPSAFKPAAGWLRPTTLILLFPLVLLLGAWVSQNPRLAWLFLPPLHILAIGLPVWWLAYLGFRQLPMGSSQRAWGVFGSGLVLGPALILLSELAALVVFGLLAFLLISNQPDLRSQLTVLMQHLEVARSSPEVLMRYLGPFLARPEVLFGVLAFGAVIVPLIEEALKPIGVWLLVGFQLSPAEGFAAGVLSGSGYALFESLVLTSNGGDWVFLVLARLGTAVIHILTVGLTGWALALAWREGRYPRLALTYLVAVSIHGLWNGLTLISGYASYMELQGNQPPLPLVSRFGSVASLGLGLLTIGAFVVLLVSNTALRRKRALAEGDHAA